MDNIKIIKDQPNTPPSDTSRRVNVTVPASHFIPDDILCHQIVDIYDSNIIKQHLYNEGQLTNYQIAKICNQSARILTEEPNLIRVKKKTAIIGDIHGQFYDLLNILKDFDLRHDTLVFLGDYVDRGTFSTEVYLYLLSLKIQYPKNLFILRGNHESERMTSYFTFKQECMQKYSLNIYKKFVESFKTLPLAAIVNDAFCCHGGISPHMVTVNDINAIDRAKEVPYDGLFCDLLWSDPNPKFVSKKEYAKNRQRNCSYFYNYKAVKNFLDVNKLKMIIRGHEVQQTGYKSISHEDSLVLTIFSAPNYCDAYGNTGAYIIYDKTLTIIRYDAVEHPFYLPNFSDGINWSFPFICEKIGELYIDLLKIANQDDDRVCKFISSMALMRNDRECINEIDEESTELPCCSLKSLDIDLSYDDAKSSDSVNEKVIDKDDIIEDRSSSCTNEIIKNLDDSELSTVLTNSTVEVDNNKGVLEVKIDNIKKNNKTGK